MIALLGYPEVFKDLGFDYKKYVLYLNDLMVETDEYFAEKKANRPQRYTDNYIIDKRLAPVYMEMEEAGASPTEQDRFIIEVFSHFKYLGYEGNQTESDKLNSVRKYRERSLANHTVK